MQILIQARQEFSRLLSVLYRERRFAVTIKYSKLAWQAQTVATTGLRPLRCPLQSHCVADIVHQ